MILILDNNPPKSKYTCPLTTCSHQSASVSTIMGHMWKVKRKNAPNKTCVGQNSPSLTLYPKLFYNSRFAEATHPTLKQEYPEYKWEIIQPYIIPPDDSPPNIISLIEQFDMFITKEFLNNYPNIKIPENLKQFSSISSIKHINDFIICDFANCSQSNFITFVIVTISDLSLMMISNLTIFIFITINQQKPPNPLPLDHHQMNQHGKNAKHRPQNPWMSLMYNINTNNPYYFHR